jgi:Circularly permutated YpsA SLOG family
MPLSFLSEEGPRPEFAELYGAREVPRDDYKARTEQNVRDSDATLWFGSPGTTGGKTTLNMAKSIGKPRMLVRLNYGIRSPYVVAWLIR